VVSYIRRQDLAATQMADTIQDVKRIAPCVISPRLERGAGPRRLRQPVGYRLRACGLSGHERHELGGHGDEGAHHVAVFVFEDVAVVHVAAL